MSAAYLYRSSNAIYHPQAPCAPERSKEAHRLLFVISTAIGILTPCGLMLPWHHRIRPKNIEQLRAFHSVQEVQYGAQGFKNITLTNLPIMWILFADKVGD